MILCFDVGNTDIDVGVFENDMVTNLFHIPYTKGQPVDQYISDTRLSFEKENIQPDKVSSCVLCSNVDVATAGVCAAIKEILGYQPYIFNKADADIEIKTDNPAEVGTDIVAICLAVKKRYSLPAIVIGMGTATTVSAVDANGALPGVSILTGVMTNLNALKDSTGLPIDPRLESPGHIIGTNTPDSIAGGIVLGSAYMMDGIIKAFEKEMGAECNVYATGALAKFIMPHCEKKCFVNENLLIEGVYRHYKENSK